jgi:hypothetical protein
MPDEGIERDREPRVPAFCSECGVGAVRAGDGTYVIRHLALCPEFAALHAIEGES